MPNRRRFLQGLSLSPLATRLGFAAAPAKRDYFKELGLRPFINAAGTYTTLTASLMPPEVVQAWEYASKQYVHLIPLHDAVAQRIASIVRSEAAMVTAGAASALTLGTAACMTGKSMDMVRRLPDTAGMKTEVIIQKSHRNGYDHAVRNCGTRFIEVETAEELEQAITPNTAMMFFFNAQNNRGKIPDQEFVRLGKKHGVPTFNDAAADVPPIENLWKYTQMGFDLVTFSGGKGICGPQSAGLLLGRKELIDAARMNAWPNSDSIGRGMKVNKEELLAMMVAVDSFVNRDQQATWREWEKRVKQVADAVASVKTVNTEQFVPEIANAVPHLRITWDQSVVKITPREAAQKLREGEPSIELRPGSRDALEVAVWMMQPGDAQVVGRRIREVLRSA
jgi:D-glucosaminate-6-phosphate ammonia-lyase